VEDSTKGLHGRCVHLREALHASSVEAESNPGVTELDVVHQRTLRRMQKIYRIIGGSHKVFDMVFNPHGEIPVRKLSRIVCKRQKMPVVRLLYLRATLSVMGSIVHLSSSISTSPSS
jgi:hypothetical protein